MTLDRAAMLETKSLSEIANLMAQAGPNSATDQACRAEFLLRQTELLRRSTEASESASTAAINSAAYSRKYTLYTFWSVLLLLISVMASVGSDTYKAISDGRDNRVLFDVAKPGLGPAANFKERR